MSPAEFRDAYPAEGRYVEFKRGVSGSQLQNTAVAFSNADGGLVLIGVEDDGNVCGRSLDAGTQDNIHRALQEARDVGRYSLSQIDVAGRSVIVLAIARRREGFAQTSGGGSRSVGVRAMMLSSESSSSALRTNVLRLAMNPPVWEWDWR